MGLHLGARADEDALDPTVRLGGHPEHVFRYECSETADLPQHGAALHLIYPYGGALYRGCSRFELGEPPCDERDREHDHGRDDDPPDHAAARCAFSRYVHCHVILTRARPLPACRAAENHC